MPCSLLFCFCSFAPRQRKQGISELWSTAVGSQCRSERGTRGIGRSVPAHGVLRSLGGHRRRAAAAPDDDERDRGGGCRGRREGVRGRCDCEPRVPSRQGRGSARHEASRGEAVPGPPQLVHRNAPGGIGNVQQAVAGTQWWWWWWWWRLLVDNNNNNNNSGRLGRNGTARHDTRIGLAWRGSGGFAFRQKQYPERAQTRVSLL